MPARHFCVVTCTSDSPAVRRDIVDESPRPPRLHLWFAFSLGWSERRATSAASFNVPRTNGVGRREQERLQVRLEKTADDLLPSRAQENLPAMTPVLRL